MSTIVNLIPADRRLTRRRHRRLARWTTVGAVYGLLLAVVYGVALVRWGNAGEETYRRLDAVRSAQATSQQTMGQLRSRMAEARRLLHADRAITQRPDWSVALILLAETLDDELVLQGCRLDPPAVGASDGNADPAQRRGPQTLQLRGMAAAPLAVSRLALRLEETGLFARVAVVETRRSSFGQRKIVTFSIECVIEDGAEA